MILGMKMSGLTYNSGEQMNLVIDNPIVQSLTLKLCVATKKMMAAVFSI